MSAKIIKQIRRCHFLRPFPRACLNIHFSSRQDVTQELFISSPTARSPVSSAFLLFEMVLDSSSIMFSRFLSMDPVVAEYFKTVMSEFPVETCCLSFADDRPQFFAANLPRFENHFLLSAFNSNLHLYSYHFSSLIF